MNASPKPAKPIGAKRLRKLAAELWDVWRELDLAEKAGANWNLSELARQLDAAQKLAHSVAEAAALHEAELKDRRGGEGVLYTVFAPDDLLGMKITERTAHRVMTRRVSTFMDLVGVAFLGSRKDLDQYKPQWRAAADYEDPWRDLDNLLHPYGWSEEKRAAAIGPRVADVMERFRRWQQKGGPEQTKEAA